MCPSEGANQRGTDSSTPSSPILVERTTTLIQERISQSQVHSARGTENLGVLVSTDCGIVQDCTRQLSSRRRMTTPKPPPTAVQGDLHGRRWGDSALTRDGSPVKGFRRARNEWHHFELRIGHRQYQLFCQSLRNGPDLQHGGGRGVWRVTNSSLVMTEAS